MEREERTKERRREKARISELSERKKDEMQTFILSPCDEVRPRI